MSLVGRVFKSWCFWVLFGFFSSGRLVLESCFLGGFMCCVKRLICERSRVCCRSCCLVCFPVYVTNRILPKTVPLPSHRSRSTGVIKPSGWMDLSLPAWTPRIGLHAITIFENWEVQGSSQQPRSQQPLWPSEAGLPPPPTPAGGGGVLVDALLVEIWDYGRACGHSPPPPPISHAWVPRVPAARVPDRCPRRPTADQRATRGERSPRLLGRHPNKRSKVVLG